MPNEVDDVSLADTLGEHRDLPGDDDAMFTVDEIATTNTVLRASCSRPASGKQKRDRSQPS